MASWELAAEVADLLRRPKLRRYGLREEEVESALLLMAPLLPGVDVDVDVRDPDDAAVVGAAIAGAAEAIVTGDGDLLDDDELRQWLLARRVELLRPRDLLERIGGP